MEVKKEISVSVKLSSSLTEKLECIMDTYDMKRSEALRFLINQGYKILDDIPPKK